MKPNETNEGELMLIYFSRTLLLKWIVELESFERLREEGKFFMCVCKVQV
jgi:hypothetical protein